MAHTTAILLTSVCTCCLCGPSCSPPLFLSISRRLSSVCPRWDFSHLGSIRPWFWISASFLLWFMLCFMCCWIREPGLWLLYYASAVGSAAVFLPVILGFLSPGRYARCSFSFNAPGWLLRKLGHEKILNFLILDCSLFVAPEGEFTEFLSIAADETIRHSILFAFSPWFTSTKQTMDQVFVWIWFVLFGDVILRFLSILLLFFFRVTPCFNFIMIKESVGFVQLLCSCRTS